MRHFRVLEESEIPENVMPFFRRIKEDTRGQLGEEFAIHAVEVDIRDIGHLSLEYLAEINEDRAGQILGRVAQWDMSDSAIHSGTLIVSSIAPLTRKSSEREVVAHIRWLRDSYGLNEVQSLPSFGNSALLAGSLLAIHEKTGKWLLKSGDAIRTDAFVRSGGDEYVVVLGCVENGLWCECWDQRADELETLGAIFTSFFSRPKKTQV